MPLAFYLKGVIMNPKILALILLFPPIHCMNKTIEFKTLEIPKEKRLSLETMSPTQLKRLSQEIIEIQDQDEVGSEGCKCTPMVITDVVASIGGTLAAIGSVVLSIITLFVNK